MTKSKSQLRAEAVERLKNYDKRKHKNLARCVLGDRYEDVSFEANRLMLIDLLTDDAHESRGSYEERLHDVPVSDCPYCGCKRVVIHDYSDMYEEPHSYRVEHMDEKEAFEAGCFESYYSFDSAKEAVEHANMHDMLIDEPTNGIEGETNGIADGSPLVDEPPESDAIAHARWRWKYRHEDGDEVVMSEYNCNLLMSDLDAIADMVERDYVSREAYEDLREEFTWETTFLHRMGKKCGTKDVPSLVAYVDKLEAERDELQRQLGTMPAPYGNLDAQSRAEIEDAERSRAVSGDAAAEVDSGTGGTEKTPQEPRECGRITFTDTREMLEADVRKWFADEYYDDYYSEEDMNLVVSKWLDRQAAITTQECTDVYESGCEACRRAQKREIAELKRQLDTMRDVAREFRDERAALQEKVDALEVEKRECMEDCANRVSAALVERDRYREKLGRAIDAAHEIVRIMEDER